MQFEHSLQSKYQVFWDIIFGVFISISNNGNINKVIDCARDKAEDFVSVVH